MTRTTRKSFIGKFIVILIAALTALVLALRIVSAPAFITAPNAGNKVDVDTMNGVKVSYSEAPDDLLTEDYTKSDKGIAAAGEGKGTPKPDEQVTVIVSLNGTPMMQYATSKGMTVGQAMDTVDGRNNLENLNTIRARALNDVSGYLIESKFTYTTVMNAFSATVKYKDIEKIESSKYVKSVILSNTYLAPQTVTENFVEVYESGIFDSSSIGYDGTGTVVAVVDTGTDYTHEVFDMDLNLSTVAMTKDDVASVAPLLTATSLSADKGDAITEDDLYIKSKLPFAYDYADSDTNVYPHNSHGTHVAGIIAGKSDEITGVAVGAQIATFKVFSDYRDGAQTEWILAALNDAVTLGVDAINMSLGTSCGFSREVDEAEINEVYDAINEAGICLVVAASNDYSSAQGSTWGNTNLSSNPDSGTVGSPASYDASLAVASVSGVKTKYFTVDDEEVYFAESRLVGKTDPNDFVAELLGDKDDGEFEYVVVPGVGLSVNYSQIDVAGKIAVVRRGTSNFEEKVRVAADKGAIGVIVYNNVSGTISMSVGTKYTVPSCFVTMDLAENMVAKGSGVIKVSKSYLAGPFMSDFSSWGVLPDLKLTPDITAHGGEIYSAVAGGDLYDRYSGTSMASPNLAGALILVRQYVKEQHPEYTANQVRDESYSRMMSTATTVRNQEGNPYSPRKQGAGLANIAGSIDTQAYLTVDGSNKPKQSLGDDPDRTGVYTLKFNLVNASGNAVSYNFRPYVMTESMSSDGRTVAEKAYMFDDTVNSYSIEQKVGKAVLNGNSISLSGHGEVSVTARIELSAADKAYLDRTFRNGMYVEGFLKLESNNLDGIDLGIPYLAFYGNWADAPMLDVTAYQVGESAADDSVLEEDKLKPDVYGTLPFSGFASSTAADGMAYYGMGHFAYIPASGYESPEPQEKYAALTVNPDGDYMLYAISAGLLRGAKRVDMEIRNSATGELIWSGVDYNARKTHSSGGDQTGGFVNIELDIRELDLPNNARYTFTMECFLDWQDGNGEYTYGNNNKFSFEFTVDNEKPDISDVAVRKVKERSGNSYRYYLDITAYDNHYLQGYALSTYEALSTNSSGNKVFVNSKSLTNGVVPVDGNFNSDTTLTWDITSYWNTIMANEGKIFVNLMDYAKNSQYFFIEIEQETDLQIEKTRTASDEYPLVPNGQIDLKDSIIVKTNTVDDVDEDDKSFIENYWNVDLVWESSDESVAIVYDGLVTGVKDGTAVIRVRTSKDIPFDINDTKHCLQFTITVAGEPTEIALSGVELSAESLMLERGETATITASLKPYNYHGTHKLNWSSTGSNVRIESVSADGMTVTIKALDSGSATVRATVDGSRISGYCSVRVRQEFEMTNSIYLRSYNGRGDENGVVEIPDDMGIVYIYPQAFATNEYIKKVIIPEGVTTIMRAAFASCSALEEVVLPSTVETIEEAAFASCSKLKSINLGDVKTIGEQSFWGCAMESIDLSKCTYIDKFAFVYCDSLKSLDLSRVGIVGGGAFAHCNGLESVVIPANTSMGVEGQYTDGGVFGACENLRSVVIKSNNVGVRAFLGCTKLQSVIFENDVDLIDEMAFYGCTALTNVTFRGSVYRIAAMAFAGSGLTSFTLPKGLTILEQGAFMSCTKITQINVSSGALLTDLDYGSFYGTSLRTFVVENGNKYLSSESGVLFDRDKTRLISYPRYNQATSYTVPRSVKTIGKGAFSNANYLRSVNIGSVEYIESNAFRGSSVSSVTGYDNVKYIGDYAFGSTAITTLPITAKTEYIGDFAFFACQSLTGASTELIVPSSVDHIGAYAFSVAGLTSVSFADSQLTSVGIGAFTGCTKLATVNFGKLERLSDLMFGSVGVTIGETNTVMKCDSLKTVVIPDTVKSIGAGVFESSALTSVTLSSALTSISDYAFAGTNLTSIIIPDSVTSIGEGAFDSVKTISSVDLNNVVSIGANAFENTELTAVSSEKVTSVGGEAFKGCNNLTSVVLPNATYIGNSAFAGCAKLATVELENVETVGSNAFENCVRIASLTLDNAETIGDAAFKGATALDTVSLGNVKALGSKAFDGTAITSLSLPVSLDKVADGAFVGASKLVSISVAEGNSKFVSDSGVLYSKNDSGYYTLLGYPMGKRDASYTALDRTVKLGAYSFNGNTYLGELTLPVHLQVIGVSAMSGMSGLKTLNLNAVSAPTLESTGSMQPDTSEVAGKDDMTYVNVYDNFPFAMTEASGDHTLVINIPANHSGYDNRIWKKYVGKLLKPTKELHAESGTLEIIERISNLPLDPTAADADEINMLARLYNILNAAQRAIVLGTYDYTDDNGNSIPSEYYENLFGGKDFRAILSAAQSKLPSSTTSGVNGETVTSATDGNSFVLFGVVGAIVVVCLIAAMLAVIVKRRNRA